MAPSSVPMLTSTTSPSVRYFGFRAWRWKNSFHLVAAGRRGSQRSAPVWAARSARCRPGCRSAAGRPGRAAETGSRACALQRGEDHVGVDHGVLTDRIIWHLASGHRNPAASVITNLRGSAVPGSSSRPQNRAVCWSWLNPATDLGPGFRPPRSTPVYQWAFSPLVRPAGWVTDDRGGRLVLRPTMSVLRRFAPERGGPMALSEYERRKLEEIERSLHRDDPALATILVSGVVRRHRPVVAAVVFAGGLGALVAGAVTAGSLPALGVAMSVLGFAAMVGGAGLFFSGPVPARRAAAAGGSGSRSGSSWRARMEAWLRGRFEGRGECRAEGGPRAGRFSGCCGSSAEERPKRRAPLGIDDHHQPAARAGLTVGLRQQPEAPPPPSSAPRKADAWSSIRAPRRAVPGLLVIASAARPTVDWRV